MNKITIKNRFIAIPNELKSMKYDDPAFRNTILLLLQQVWQHKDKQLSQLNE